MYVIIPVLAVAITLLVIQLLSRNTLQRIAYRCEVNMSLVEPDEVATLTYRVYNTSSWPIMFVSFSFQFRSDTTRRAFTFRGVAYEPVGHVGGGVDLNLAGCDLLTKPPHVNIHGAGISRIGSTPDRFQQLFSGVNLVGIGYEQVHKLVFLGRQVDLLTFYIDSSAVTIDLQAARLDGLHVFLRFL